MHVCTDCDVENDLIPDTTKENLIIKGQTRNSAIQPTGRQTTKDQVPRIEDFTVEQTKDAFFKKLRHNSEIVDWNSMLATTDF